MKKKVIKLTESDLKNIVLKVVQEQDAPEQEQPAPEEDVDNDDDMEVTQDGHPKTSSGMVDVALLKDKNGNYLLIGADENGQPVGLGKSE
jgi:hypothetical protein